MNKREIQLLKIFIYISACISISFALLWFGDLKNQLIEKMNETRNQIEQMNNSSIQLDYPKKYLQLTEEYRNLTRYSWNDSVSDPNSFNFHILKKFEKIGIKILNSKLVQDNANTAFYNYQFTCSPAQWVHLLNELAASGNGISTRKMALSIKSQSNISASLEVGYVISR